MRYDRLKRCADVVISVIALGLLWPLILGVAAAVALRLGRPVLFRQRRAGLDGAPFTLVKFRSMLPPDPEAGRTSDGARLTRFGHLLRATSLDELPELLNIVRGEMSLVGPRPLLTDYLDRYDDEQARRHTVRPGLTGLAQVRGRNDLTWDERLRLDVRYVEMRGPLLDASILVQTVAVVLRGDGVASTGQATTTEFRGSAARPT